MITLQTNANNDLFINESGSIPTISGIDALSQIINERLTHLRSELRYSPESGIDYEQTLWIGSPNILSFTRQARLAILSLSDVDSIVSFDVVQDISSFSFSSVINTSFGQLEVNNALPIQ